MQSCAELARLDLIAPAQLDAVDAHLAGCDVNQPLHVVIALRPAGAAISGHLGRVGENALCRDLKKRCAIDALHILHGVRGGRYRRDLREKCAHIAEDGQADGQEITLRIERKLGGKLVVAPMAVRNEAARALVSPFDRAAKRARRMQHAHIFRKRCRFHAERAADMPGNIRTCFGSTLRMSAMLPFIPNTPWLGTCSV